MDKEKTAPQEQGAVAAYKKIFLNKMQLHAYSAATIASLERLNCVNKRILNPQNQDAETKSERLRRWLNSCFGNTIVLEISFDTEH